MNKDLINLIDLNNLLNKKFNTKIITCDIKDNSIIPIYRYTIKFILIIILLIIFYYIIIVKFDFIKKNIIFNITFNIFFIILILYYIKKFQNEIIMRFLYNKNKFTNIDKSENKIDIDSLKTGDILQDTFIWRMEYGILQMCLLNNYYLHCIMVLKYKSSIFGLHYTSENFKCSSYYIEFNNKYIEIFPLKEYLYNYYDATKKYRIFRIKNELNYNKIFNFINLINNKNITFGGDFYNIISNLSLKERKKLPDKFTCLSFLLYLLNYLNIIPFNNYKIFTPDDLILLPEFSNVKYLNEYVFNI